MKMKYWGLIIFALLISLASTLVVNGVMLVKAPHWFPDAQNNDWIGFYGNLAGALIGAAATIFVFIRTIQHNERKNSTDKRLDVLPYMNLKILETELLEKQEGIEVQHFVREGDPDSISLMNISMIPHMQYESVFIELENISRGLATNVGILRFGNVKENRFNPEGNFFDSSSSFLPVGATRRIVLLLPMDEEIKSRKDLIVCYTDILGSIYEQTIQLDFIKRNKTKHIAGKDYPTYLIYTRMIDSPRLTKTYPLD